MDSPGEKEQVPRPQQRANFKGDVPEMEKSRRHPARKPVYYVEKAQVYAEDETWWGFWVVVGGGILFGLLIGFILFSSAPVASGSSWVPPVEAVGELI